MDKNRAVGTNVYGYQYDLMYEKFLNNEISKDEWSDFCICTLEKLLYAYSDVLERLKN